MLESSMSLQAHVVRTHTSFITMRVLSTFVRLVGAVLCTTAVMASQMASGTLLLTSPSAVASDDRSTHKGPTRTRVNRVTLGQVPPPRMTGPAMTVFNASVATCGAQGHDNVDSPARAFVGADGQVRLVASCNTARLMVGPSLDTVQHVCNVVHNSTMNPDPGVYAEFEWIHAVYATDNGTTIYALLHDEFHGYMHPHQCNATPYRTGLCQMFAVTSAVSRDSGRTWTPTRPPPHHLVAAVPHVYVGDNSTLWFGWGDTGGIVKSPHDGYYYTTAHNRATIGSQVNGTCLFRTRDLSDPSSWRAWDGVGFNVTFINPYTQSPNPNPKPTSNSESNFTPESNPHPHPHPHPNSPTNPHAPDRHICTVLEDGPSPLPRGNTSHQPTVNQGLVWSVHLNQFVAVLWNTRPDPSIAGGAVFAFATSPDLVTWSPPQPLPLPRDLPAGHLMYPSLLDPDAPARGDTSFDTIDATPWLYFGLANPAGTTLAHHWDALVRVPLEWS
eukprot:m.202629 g.202629  ORF g.202629 m.202629 type:complete len:499 (+) comp21829_c0_seq1:87-1583(+)